MAGGSGVVYVSPIGNTNCVEFIRGVGIVTNGSVDTSQGTTGPWSWTPSIDTVASIDIVAGGAGGGCGAVDVAAGSGGGGGGGGMQYIGNQVALYKGQTLSIVVGAKGTGAVNGGAAATAGGDSSITTVATQFDPQFFGSTTAKQIRTNASTVGANGIATASQTGGAGGIAGGLGSGGVGGTNTGTVGGMGSAQISSPVLDRYLWASYSGCGGGGSGPATAGAGGTVSQSGLRMTTAVVAGAASGNYAGGGVGGFTLFGRPAASGSGNSAGAATTPSAPAGYGCGGGGGGASNTSSSGGDGGDGYVRILFV